jgi:hypothetical protein
MTPWPWPFPIHNGVPVRPPSPKPFDPAKAPEAPF